MESPKQMITVALVAAVLCTPGSGQDKGLESRVFGIGTLTEQRMHIPGWQAIVIGCAAAFLICAVASDVRFFLVPNLLTLPALLGALCLSPMMGGTSGLMEAALGAALGFALLIGPYAVGGVGAGDVKALMALGAWLGPLTTLAAAVWALLGAGLFGLALLGFRGELVDFARRWGRNLLGTLAFRRIAYEAPSAESSASRGIPFAMALAVGLSLQWLGGSPW